MPNGTHVGGGPGERIRRRVRAGLSIDEIVPQAVARYIQTHHLYK